ncbi:hypothetical protein [Antrihabitans spumae]|uniref:DUF222 domain-containing protein n=1 Tax=Antrihabitans spumae TaxID=3373370 RepID=A0ABW7JZE9_9NOCA
MPTPDETELLALIDGCLHRLAEQLEPIRGVLDDPVIDPKLRTLLVTASATADWVLTTARTMVGNQAVADRREHVAQTAAADVDANNFVGLIRSIDHLYDEAVAAVTANERDERDRAPRGSYRPSQLWSVTLPLKDATVRIPSYTQLAADCFVRLHQPATESEAPQTSSPEDCVCRNRPLTYTELDSHYLGTDHTDGRHGEVTINQCHHCGQRWLRYYYEGWHSYAGRWFQTPVSPVIEQTVKPETATAVLDCREYFCGGSHFSGKVRWTSGPVDLWG